MKAKIFLVLLVLAGAGAGTYVYFRGVPESVAAITGTGAPGGGEEQQTPPTPVVMAATSREDVPQRIEAIGDTRARESVTLTARVAGRVQEISFEDGQEVEPGELLVSLDPADALNEVRVAEAEAEQILQAFQRAEQLANDGTGPRAVALDLQRQFEAAQAAVGSARERLADYEIRAPFAGRLGLRNISLGALIQPGAEVVVLDAIDPIDVRFSVPERYLGVVAIGAPIEALSPAFPEESFAGEISAVASRIDPALRTLLLEAAVPNPDGRLLPGMLMNVVVTLGTSEDALVVPDVAVQVEGPVHFVFREAEGKAERVEVEIGQRMADRIEILEGLGDDERVVVEGFQDLVAGDVIQEVPSEAASEEPAAPAEG